MKIAKNLYFGVTGIASIYLAVGRHWTDGAWWSGWWAGSVFSVALCWFCWRRWEGGVAK